MTPAARFAALMELTDLLLEEWQRENPRPAERVLKAYARERRYIGSGDRKALQESLFGLLRRFGELKGRAEAGELLLNGRSLALLFAGEGAEGLCTGGQYETKELTSDERHAIHKAQSTRHKALPSWLDTLLHQQYGHEADALMAALMQPAPPDLRVNTLKITREKAQAALASEGIETTPIDGLPDALEAPRHAPILRSKAYAKGWVEIQDRGSQAVVHTLVRYLQSEQGDLSSEALAKEEARSGGGSEAMGVKTPLKIIDLCAGAGGKSLALAAGLGNQARILAWDGEPKRLAELPPRAARAGAKCIEVLSCSPSASPPTEQGDLSSEALAKEEARNVGVTGGGSLLADIILLDVPCSGTGTIRRHPDLPWRLTPEKVAKYQELQRNLLRKGAEMLTSGGLLVYITCSLLENENSQCISDFLTHHPHFRVVTCPQMWNKETVENTDSLAFLPHKHQSDGFYMAMLLRE